MSRIFRQLPIRAGGNAQSSSSNHPFKVSTRSTPNSDPPTLDRIVYYNSRVITELAPINSVTVQGLASEEDPDVNDEGWALLIPNDLIWLEVGFNSSGIANSWSIKSYGAGDEWPDFPGTGQQSLIEYTLAPGSSSTYIQTKSRTIIARAPADENGDPKIIQIANTDFLMVLYTINGMVVDILEPFGGGIV